MTAQILDPPDHIRLQWHGWSYSLIMHAVIAVGAMAFLSSIDATLPSEQFSWNVAMVEPPKPQPQFETLTDARSAPAPTPPKQQVVKSPPPQPTVERIQPIQQMVSQKIMQRQIPQTVQTTSPVRTVNQTASTIVSQPVQHNATSKTITSTTERETVFHEEPAVTTIAALQQIGTPVHADGLVTHQTEEPVIQDGAIEAGSEAVARSQPIVSQSAVEAIAESPTIRQTSESAASTPQASIEQQVAHVPQARALPTTRTDYGWLMKALLGRINDLKKYPVVARVNHWEGLVVLKAVIAEDGNVVSIDIHESSGRVILDNDAIETLRKAAPIKLEHPLGKPQVAILMPISYSLR
ncbi:MAG: TonB family protein [Nitrospira sp.]|nr:TonB family protein [Nitrospira sp.]